MSKHQVIVSVETSPTPFPAGTIPDGIRVTLSGFSPLTVTAPPYVATFSEVEPGEYGINVQAFDANGQTLGVEITGSVDVAADDVSIDIPTALSVQVV